MKKLAPLAAVLPIILVFFLPSFSDAAICFGNNANPATASGGDMNGGVGLGSPGYIYAASFTPAVSCTITSASFRMKAGAGNPTDGVDVTLYNNSAGSPGTILATGALIDTSGLTSTIATTTSAITGVSLTSGTIYWISVNRHGFVGSFDNANYVSLGGEVSANWDKQSVNGGSGGSWATDGSRMVLEIDGTTAGATNPFQLWPFSMF